MSYFCFKSRKNTESKNQKIAKTKKEMILSKFDFMKVCSVQ